MLPLVSVIWMRKVMSSSTICLSALANLNAFGFLTVSILFRRAVLMRSSMPFAHALPSMLAVAPKSIVRQS
eukprot:1579301-Heterocapsa_arctica.AAC.1